MDKQLFAKLINGELVIAPHYYQDDENFIMNFDESEELMYQFGYKPVVGERPEYNVETQEIHINYIEEEKCIRKIYEIIEKVTPQFEVNSIDEPKIDNTQYENIIRENEELKQRISKLEEKQQEIFESFSQLFNNYIEMVNKVNDMDIKVNSMTDSIDTFNRFIEFYNSTKRF